MRYLTLLLIAILALGACTEKTKRVYFDGKYFPAKAKKDKGEREFFAVTVRRTSQSVVGAREAGRHAGVAYCLKNFGTSEIEWSQGPDAEDGTLVFSNGNLVLKGKCVLW